MVGKRIKQIRLEKRISLQELADKSGVGKTSIFDTEQDGSNPTINTLLRLAWALEVPVEEFFKDKAILDKELQISLTREEFKGLTDFILDESLDENNDISIFTHDGTIKFGIDRVHTEVLSEYKGGRVIINE